MNSRERIIEMRDFYEKWTRNDMAQEDAAALRELDKLCAEMVNHISHARKEISSVELLERAAKAGY